MATEVTSLEAYHEAGGTIAASLMAPMARELNRRRGEIGPLRPLSHPVYSALHGGRIEARPEGWQLLVEHLFRPLQFDRAFLAARDDGLVRCVELGPGGTLRRAVRWLGRGEVEIEAFPANQAGRRPSGMKKC